MLKSAATVLTFSVEALIRRSTHPSTIHLLNSIARTTPDIIAESSNNSSNNNISYNNSSSSSSSSSNNNSSNNTTTKRCNERHRLPPTRYDYEHHLLTTTTTMKILTVRVPGSTKGFLPSKRLRGTVRWNGRLLLAIRGIICVVRRAETVGEVHIVPATVTFAFRRRWSSFRKSFLQRPVLLTPPLVVTLLLLLLLLLRLRRPRYR
jgi:hypothetical protein